MMLKEYSGNPPPRISSRPGTPVESLRIGTGECRWSFLGQLTINSRSTHLFVQRFIRPSLAHQAEGKRFADERDQQLKQMGSEGRRRLDAAVGIVGRERFQSLHGAVRL